MPLPHGLDSDPDFVKLPLPEKAHVLAALDPEFAALSTGDRLHVAQAVADPGSASAPTSPEKPGFIERTLQGAGILPSLSWEGVKQAAIGLGGPAAKLATGDIAGGLSQAAYPMVDPVAMYRSTQEAARRATRDAEGGHYTGAAAHLLAGAAGPVGAQVANLGENVGTDIGTENWRGLAGDVTGGALAYAGAAHPEGSMAVTKGIAKGTAAVGKAGLRGAVKIASHPVALGTAAVVAAAKGHLGMAVELALAAKYGGAITGLSRGRAAAALHALQRMAPEVATQAVAIAGDPAKVAALREAPTPPASAPTVAEAPVVEPAPARPAAPEPARAAAPAEAPRVIRPIPPDATPYTHVPPTPMHPLIQDAMAKGATAKQVGDMMRALARGEDVPAFQREPPPENAGVSPLPETPVSDSAAAHGPVSPGVDPDIIAPGGWKRVGIANWYGTEGGPTVADWNQMGGAKAQRAWLESRNLIPGRGTPQDVATAVARGVPPEQIARIYGEDRMPAANPSKGLRKPAYDVQSPPAEPPVPEGHVRLYRGETVEDAGTPRTKSTGSKDEGSTGPGRWYTRNREHAEGYREFANGDDASAKTTLSYVDVPEADLPKYQRPSGHYFVPESAQPPKGGAPQAAGAPASPVAPPPHEPTAREWLATYRARMREMQQSLEQGEIPESARAEVEALAGKTDAQILSAHLAAKVQSLGQQGLSRAQITAALRDTHGLPRATAAQAVKMILGPEARP